MKSHINKKSYNWNLRLFFTIVPFILALLFACFFITSNTIVQSSKNNFTSLSQKNADALDAWLYKLVSQMQVYRSTIEYNCESADTYEQYTSASFNQDTDFPDGIYIGSKSGEYYGLSQKRPVKRSDIPKTSWFINGAYSKDFVISEPFKDALNGKTCFSISGKLNNPTDNYVISADSYVEYAEILADQMLQDSHMDGVMLLSGKSKIVLVDTFRQISGYSLENSEYYGTIISRIDEGKIGLFQDTGTDEKKYYIAITPLQNAEWYLVTYTKQSSVITPIYQNYFWMLPVAFAILIGLFLAIRFTAGLMRGVQSQSVVSREISEAIGKSYIAVAYLHLDDSTFEEVWFQPQIRDMVGRKGKALYVINTTVHKLCTEAFIPRMEKFTDLVTLDDRIFNKRSISIEFYSLTYGWCRASFIPVKTDEFGRLHTALYTLQNQEGELLELRDKLHVEDTLLECVRTLSSYDDVDDAICHLLGIIGDYHTADRAYLFMADYKNQTWNNSHKWHKPHTEHSFQVLKTIPMNSLSRWENSFKDMGFVQLLNIEKELPHESTEYTLLSSQKLKSLYAVPFFSSDGTVFGFLGVGNPTGNGETNLLLKSVASFIQEELLKKQYTDELYALSYTDKMTESNNRHAYNRDMAELNSKKAHNVGVVFGDVNGLKAANDQQGHEQGDLLIQNAAAILRQVFHQDGDSIYRIGGDEFVVFCRDISESDFEKKIEELLSSLGDIPIMSIGEAWIPTCDNMENQIKAADEMMYRRKELYYTLTGKDRRKG